MNIYVGNLSHQATENELQDVFTPFGVVQSVTIVKERLSGESRGFGFVEMPNQAEAMAAIAGLAGKELRGRRLAVNEAHPRPTDRRGGGRDRGSRGSW